MADWSELKRLAEAATQCSGPRRVVTDYNGVHQVLGDGSWKVLSAWHTPDGKGLANAQFAASASPAAILALIAENERLNKERTDWQAECLKRGFEYVRESDDHYVLADVPEMAGLLGALLGVEVRDRENHSYGETVSDLTSEVEAGIEAFHRAYEAEKERDQLKAENERLQKSLHGYQMGAQAEAEEADRLREKNKGMLEIFADLRASVRCENIHHRTADRHGIHEPCKALSRIDAAMAKEARP